MEIKRAENIFYIGNSKKDNLARLVYHHVSKNIVSADETYVSESLRGQGIGRKLLNAFVEFVRKEGYLVIPHCSYVESILSNNDEYKDIVLTNN